MISNFKKFIFTFMSLLLFFNVSYCMQSYQYGNYDTQGKPADKNYENIFGFATNDTYGRFMNQDASLGDPINIHDGTDNTYWTASAISGTWTFDSTAQAHTGTKSISGVDTINGSTMQVRDGVSANIGVALTGWVYLDTWSPAGTRHLKVYAWDPTANVQLGVSVNIDQYIDTSSLDTWQRFTIPLEDMSMSATTINALRVKTEGPLPYTDFYLDDIRIQTTGTPLYFDIEPPADTWLSINELFFVFGVTLNVTSTGEIVSMNVKQLFGQTLKQGLTIQRSVGDSTIIVASISSIEDLVSFSSIQLMSTVFKGSDNYCLFKVENIAAVPLILRSENEDKLRILLSDDFSAFGNLKAIYAGGYWYP